MPPASSKFQNNNGNGINNNFDINYNPKVHGYIAPTLSDFLKARTNIADYDNVNKYKYNYEPIWKLFDLFFSRNSYVLAQPHLDSYDQCMMETRIALYEDPNGYVIHDEIIGNKRIRHRLIFTDTGLRPASTETNSSGILKPIDAFNGSFVYSAYMVATVTYLIDTIILDGPGTEKERTTTIQRGATEKDVIIDKPPIMVKSRICSSVIAPETINVREDKREPGGQFIVSAEKVIVSTTNSIPRKMTIIVKKAPVWSFVASVQSRPIKAVIGKMQTFSIKVDHKHNTVNLNISYFNDNISVFTLMRAMGLWRDDDIINAICDTRCEKRLEFYLLNALKVPNSSAMSVAKARRVLVDGIKPGKSGKFSEFLSEAQSDRSSKDFHIQKILTQWLLPHENDENRTDELNLLHKAYAIGYIVRTLLLEYLSRNINTSSFISLLTNKLPGNFIDVQPNIWNDRDSMFNKRIEVSGNLIAAQLEQNFKKTLNECGGKIKEQRKKKGNGLNNADINVITSLKPNHDLAWKQAFRSTFGSVSKKVGLAQSLNVITNWLHFLSYFRKVTTPNIDTNNKSLEPRLTQNTHWGMYCPMETPDGLQVGTIRNFSMSTIVTIDSFTQIPIIEEYLNIPWKDFDNQGNQYLTPKVIPLIEGTNNLWNYCRVHINRKTVGLCHDPIRLRQEIRQMRFDGRLSRMVSAVYIRELKEFHIYTDAGRAMRPYFTVTNNTLNFREEMLQGIETWDEFLITYPGVIEYICKEEEVNITVADTQASLDVNKEISMMIPTTKREEIERLNATVRYSHTLFTDYSHCEIHPLMAYGLVAFNVPLLSTNMGPRMFYQFKHMHHALGAPARTNYRTRIDNGYMNYHPEIPILLTRTAKYTGTHLSPTGQNLCVAFASYFGTNQEDNGDMNSSSIDRGVLCGESHKKHSEQPKKNTDSAQISQFAKPDENLTENKKRINFNTLDNDGFAPIETELRENDAIMGIITQKQTAKGSLLGSLNNNQAALQLQLKNQAITGKQAISNTASLMAITNAAIAGSNANSKKKKYKFRDSSVYHKHIEKAVVDQIFRGSSSEGHPLAKVRTRIFRYFRIGDKLTTRFSQKITCGAQHTKKFVMYTQSGLQPDIIYNPACARRMTVGQMIEMFVSKVSCIKGYYCDGTSFTSTIDLHKFNDEWMHHSKNNHLGIDLLYGDYGYETCYNPITGKRMQMKINIGFNYIQPTKQKTTDKSHARNRGITQILTRQPLEGRSRDGGLRFGEMERDCMFAHGASQSICRLLYDNSDIFNTWICNKCGMICSMVPPIKLPSDESQKRKKKKSVYKEEHYECKTCKNTTNVSKIRIPYAAKLLIQELMTISIKPSLRTDNVVNYDYMKI